MRLAALVLLVTGTGGCAGLLGRQAAKGALEHALEEDARLPEDSPRRIVPKLTKRFVRTALTELETPVQQAKLERIARTAAAAATQGILTELERQLGPDVEARLTQTAEEVAASTAKRLSAELLFPGCEGPDRERCIERRLQAYGRAASAGVLEGARAEVRPWPLVGAFALGVLACLLVTWGVMVLRHGRGQRQMRRTVEAS